MNARFHAIRAMEPKYASVPIDDLARVIVPENSGIFAQDETIN
jgi:hypothetical protein